MKPKTIKQIFDELAPHVSPEYQASWERLGRRLEFLKPDDEILQIVWFLLMHTDICVNVFKLVVLLVVRVENTMKDLRMMLENRIADLEKRMIEHEKPMSDQEKRMIELEERMIEQQKWLKMLFYVFIGQSILLGIHVNLFEYALSLITRG